MPSIKTTLLTAAILLVSTVSSQRDYPIDVTAVDIAIRRTWCTNQKATCPLLCLQNLENSLTTEANDCDPVTLNFECICTNGISPNASEYSETIPFYKCRQFGEICVRNCGGSSECASNCRTQNPCGAQSPKLYNITTTSSAVASATAKPSNVVYDGFGGQTTPTAAAGGSTTGTARSAGVMAMDIGRSYGLAVVLSGIFAGFALVL